MNILRVVTSELTAFDDVGPTTFGFWDFFGDVVLHVNDVFTVIDTTLMVRLGPTTSLLPAWKILTQHGIKTVVREQALRYTQKVT